jgi:FlaA1/EpsC-like NDP-sugar epimerase
MNWDNVLKKPSASHIPRWVILVIDLSICLFSFVLAFALRHNFEILPGHYTSVYNALPIFFTVRFISFYFTKTYHGIVRYSGTQDIIRIFITLLIGSLSFIVVNISGKALGIFDSFIIPNSVVIIDFFISLVFMTSSRFAYKYVYKRITKGDTTGALNSRINVIIYGAGDSGLITKRTLEQETKNRLKVIAFVDDNPSKAKKRIDGVQIYHTETHLERLLKDNKVDEVIISIQNITKQRKKDIIEACLALNVKVKVIPPVEKWINGELSFSQFKKVNIEELLERDEIQLDQKKISQDIKGKTIMITGAAGSIGSEIVRQLIPFYPNKLVLVDQAETPLYELEGQLKDLFKNHGFSKTVEIIVADIRCKEKLEYIIANNAPDIIYHAAAYKHVPLMENNPDEAIATNVRGTKTLADLAVKYGIGKFVMVSTDKAVNPTNVMGASKRIAEIYVQSLNNWKGNTTTRFITTRFGNVLGSNGSVIPLFKKQIAEGGPITVTHPEITRYFMTIPEACQLVIEAGNMGNGGEIFIFDMGQSVKIVDLAKKMIKLSGLTLGKDISIEFTGLRPGEKLMEELLNDSENTLPTHHPKITIAKIKPYDYDVIQEEVSALIDLLNVRETELIVRKMKQIVPEYISNNSVFTSLDMVKLPS